MKMGMETWLNVTDRGKTCPNVILPNTNLTWSDKGSKPGLRGYRPATNRLSHGTEKMKINLNYS